MNYAKDRFYLMALLLVSSAFFPSAQEAFAADETISNGQDLHVPSDLVSAGNIIIESGGKLTIDDGATLSITGILTIQNGGHFTIEENGTLEFNGSTTDNGI